MYNARGLSKLKELQSLIRLKRHLDLKVTLDQCSGEYRTGEYIISKYVWLGPYAHIRESIEQPDIQVISYKNAVRRPPLYTLPVRVYYCHTQVDSRSVSSVLSSKSP